MSLLAGTRSSYSSRHPLVIEPRLPRSEPDAHRTDIDGLACPSCGDCIYRCITVSRLISPATSTAVRDGAATGFDAEGTLDLHGVTQPARVRGEVTWLKASEQTGRRLPGDLLHLRAGLEVPLPAFGIESHLSPTSLDKVAATLEVVVDVFASTQRPQVPEKMLQELARARREHGQRLLGS